MNGEYDDIINIPYRKSDNYPHMSLRDRAAQFAPFSALTGYSDIVDEVGRLTDERKNIDEYELEAINRELQYAIEFMDRKPFATVVYFLPDQEKCGGAYSTVSDHLEQIDEYERYIKFESGVIVPIDEIMSLKIDKI